MLRKLNMSKIPPNPIAPPREMVVFHGGEFGGSSPDELFISYARTTNL